jgi:arylsulfatase A
MIAAGLASILLSGPVLAAERPNILLIVADDLGWRDLGYVGNTYVRTPRIDALAQEARRFRQAYAAAPVCSPSRAALITGASPARLGLTDWLPGPPAAATGWIPPTLPTSLPTTYPTIGERLSAVGYRCGWIGKWHLGDDPPAQRGFPHERMNNGGGQPRSYMLPTRMPDTAEAPAGSYLTDLQGAAAAAFIAAPDPAPWCLVLSFYAPHKPLQAPASTVARYTAEDRVTDAGAGMVARAVDGHPVYAAMIEHLDSAVGAALDAVAARGGSAPTVVMLTSDNGGLSVGSPEAQSPSCSAPLRGGKGQTYEGGIRVPLLIRMPGMAPGDLDTPVVGTDLAPTIAALAGLPQDPAADPDGRSLLPLLTGDGAWAERPLVWHYPHAHGRNDGPSSALRLGAWKLRRHDPSGRVELFDLSHDPYELADRAAVEPERAAALTALLDAELDRMGAQRARRPL